MLEWHLSITLLMSVMFYCLGNHKKMLIATGYKAENIKEYRYFASATKSLDFNGMVEDLEVRKYDIMMYSFN